MVYAAALVALMLGLIAGERFPDIDQRTDLLLHRSVLTHGLLLPLALHALASRTQLRIVRWLVMGISLGVAVHLAFDLFPRAWQGYALISLPIYGWLPPAVSWGWIALSGCVCLYVAAKLVRNGLEAAVFTAGLVGVFAYAVPGEHALWRPMLATAAATTAVIFAALVTYRRPGPNLVP